MTIVTKEKQKNKNTCLWLWREAKLAIRLFFIITGSEVQKSCPQLWLTMQGVQTHVASAMQQVKILSYHSLFWCINIKKNYILIN